MSVNFNAIVPNNFPYNNRVVLDNTYIQNVVGPTATASPVVTNTNALDLLNTTPYPVTETINVLVAVGVQTTANTANSKNINVILQHTTANTDGTANSSNWVNIATLGAQVAVTDNSATGWAAQGNVVYKLPPLCQRFIRGQFTIEANGGNASSATCTCALAF